MKFYLAMSSGRYAVLTDPTSEQLEKVVVIDHFLGKDQYQITGDLMQLAIDDMIKRVKENFPKEEYSRAFGRYTDSLRQQLHSDYHYSWDLMVNQESAKLTGHLGMIYFGFPPTK